MVVRRAWDVVPLTSESGDRPLAKTVAGRPNVLCRTQPGPVVLADRHHSSWRDRCEARVEPDLDQFGVDVTTARGELAARPGPAPGAGLVGVAAGNG